ncbi:pyridoxal-phosphate dependent enzyme [Kribbella sp. NPDC051770]|uniref:pyridoxal-phosphate dependent enzyme n=1 Tax=Kribbella sp. NPDC051770 TaxID=3155413 RepID=UPI003427E647
MKVSLGTWPTPLEHAPRLAAAIGLTDLWLKRDDLGGLGAGGNKTRKLEWTLGAALAEGAETVVTTGAPQSNHARLTAAAAARLGLRAVLVFPGEAGQSRSGNLALDGLFGARVVWAGERDRAEVAAELVAESATTALIPFGGSNALGAQGYVECGQELKQQLPEFTTAVVALGSGGTMAGLVAELGPERVLGVDTGALADPVAVVAELASEVSGRTIAPEELRVRREQVGAGYPHFTKESAAALTVAARTEGVVLDPIYTGRAMAGLIAAVEDGTLRPGDRPVFVHTGGLPGFFGNADAVAYAESHLS